MCNGEAVETFIKLVDSFLLQHVSAPACTPKEVLDKVIFVSSGAAHNTIFHYMGSMQ